MEERSIRQCGQGRRRTMTRRRRRRLVVVTRWLAGVVCFVIANHETAHVSIIPSQVIISDLQI